MADFKKESLGELHTVRPWRKAGPDTMADLFYGAGDAEVADALLYGSGSIPVSVHLNAPDPKQVGTHSLPRDVWIEVRDTATPGAGEARELEIVAMMSGKEVHSRHVKWLPKNRIARDGLQKDLADLVKEVLSD